jgi:hypothetical protein
LLCKHEVLSSNPSPTQEKENKQQKNAGENTVKMKSLYTIDMQNVPTTIEISMDISLKT